MSDSQPEDHKPWIVHEEREVFARPPFLNVFQQTVETGSGKIIRDFFLVNLRPFSLVVPFLKDGRVLVIRQYKHGPASVGLSFPAGLIEEGEDAESSAQRELLEETGLASDSVRPLGKLVDSGNQRVCEGNYFVAKDCWFESQPNAGDLEDFEYLFMRPAEIDRAVLNGEFAVVHHVAAWGLVLLTS